ncbi:MAG: hypothetical protein C0424_12595 [Sphingobacteriaceae bacterium]|nr:hypothetical protein [Sphingobacteriaceae bacterium]
MQSKKDRVHRSFLFYGGGCFVLKAILHYQTIVMLFAPKMFLTPFLASRWMWVCVAFLMFLACESEYARPKKPTDTKHFNFVLQLNEYQTNAPVANAQVTFYRFQSTDRHSNKIDKYVSYKGNTDDSGRVVINQELLGVDYIEIFSASPDVHLPLNYYVTRPISSVLQLFMDSKAYLRLHFDFAAFDSIGSNGRFDEVIYDLRSAQGSIIPRGSLSQSTLLLPVQVKGGRPLTLECIGIKQGVVIHNWMNQVSVPPHQTYIHTVHF